MIGERRCGPIRAALRVLQPAAADNLRITRDEDDGAAAKRGDGRSGYLDKIVIVVDHAVAVEEDGAVATAGPRGREGLDRARLMP